MKTKRKRRSGKPDPVILADIVRRIVEVAKPERIVLFGSAARGEMGPDSDLDLLVIKGGKFSRNRVTTAIYRHLSGEIGVDAVVVTPEEVERYRDAHCLVICPAIREGKVVYVAEAMAAHRSARMAPPRAQQPRARPRRESRSRLSGIVFRRAAGCRERR
jgi:predicted nucleotidyltransferase